MAEPLRLLAVLAHPDDETLGLGGTLAKYAAEGAETYVVTATRGERGWRGAPDEDPGLAALGQVREAELRAAAKILGVREVAFLDYIDGDLDQAPPAEIIGRIAGHLRRVRPQVVVSFGPDGAYGHPDHIAISQFTTAALLVAAGEPGGHQVSKLYHMADNQASMALYSSVFGDLMMRVDGVDRRWLGWEDWAISARLDTDAHWETVMRAITCHPSQVDADGALIAAIAENHAALLGRPAFYRALSRVNGGRALETDLFAGLR